MAVYYEVGGLIANVMVTRKSVRVADQACFAHPDVAFVAMAVTWQGSRRQLLINERSGGAAHAEPRVAVEQGFDRAFSSIFDGQITTLIAAVVLFQYGTGPIKGFAVTTIFGICASLFTGVFCSRVAFDWVVRGLRVRRLRVG